MLQNKLTPLQRDVIKLAFVERRTTALQRYSQANTDIERKKALYDYSNALNEQIILGL